jgi:cytidylate kinase
MNAAAPLTPHPSPVITIDGPSASGKGTVAERVAKALGFHFLDSGALYRLTALSAMKNAVALNDEARVAELAAALPATFREGAVWLADENVSDAIRAEAVGEGASKVAALPAVRAALLDRQRAYRQAPGLVADGRDMGTVIFPDAATKIFLTASAEARAERRYKQLIDKGNSASLTALVADMQARDARDTARLVAPLKPAPDALFLDTTSMDVESAVQAVLLHHRNSKV